MALSKDRIVVVGETPHAHEAAAVKWVNEQLPDVDPYHTWALFDLYDPSTGRSHEIDILVLGYSALYLVEVKSHPGHIEGDRVDWTWTRPDGSKGYLEPPYSLTNLKAKVLKTRLQKELGRDTPWVEALVLLSSDEL
ncbi:MAG: nuclease-related domain-containing protein, partial [Polyangiaceae bacterium]